MRPTRDKVREEFTRELRKAWDRVMSFPNGAIDWLIHFLQLDLEALTPSEWMIVAYEVASFCEQASPRRYAMPTASACGWSVQAIPHETLEYTLPSRKEASHLQQSIRGYLEHLWQHAVAPFTFSDLTLVVTAPGAFTDRYGSVLVATKPKTKEFEYRVAVLLAEYSGRVRPCKECHRIFLAARRDQLFCTPRCQMRVASRKWRKTNNKTGRKEHR